MTIVTCYILDLADRNGSRYDSVGSEIDVEYGVLNIAWAFEFSVIWEDVFIIHNSFISALKVYIKYIHKAHIMR